MRKSLPFVLLAALALLIAGCGKELNDENFVDYWIASVNAGTEEDAAAIADEYGWTTEEVDAYLEELGDDEDRAEKVIEDVEAKDEAAAFALAMALGFDSIFGDLSDLEALGDLEGFGEEFAEGMEAFGEGMGELFSGFAQGMESMAEGIDEGLAGLGGLNDDALAEIYINAESPEDIPAELLEKYDTTPEDVDAAFEALEEDPERVQSVSEKIHALDDAKGDEFDEIFM